jgi:hypothetical protein
MTDTLFEITDRVAIVTADLVRLALNFRSNYCAAEHECGIFKKYQKRDCREQVSAGIPRYRQSSNFYG